MLDVLPRLKYTIIVNMAHATKIASLIDPRMENGQIVDTIFALGS